MIPAPGLRRFFGGNIEEGLSFASPLLISLVPTLSAGSATPTFTRATTAYVLGYGPTDNAADGLKLIQCASGEARFTGARRISEGVWSDTFADGSSIPSTTLLGYLAEGARTNLCLQSNAFTTAPWADSGTPGPTQNLTGPDGGTTGWTFTDNDAGVFERTGQPITLTAATHAASVYVKKTTGSQSSYPIVYLATATLIAIATVDTSNGVATAWTAYTGLTIATGLTARCVSHNANWWRVEISFTATAVAWTFTLVPAGTTNATQSTGAIDATAQGTAGFSFGQVELGSFASSYIPTTAGSAPRNADVLTYASAGNVSGTAGSAYAEVVWPNAFDAARFIAVDGGSSFRTVMQYRSASTRLSTYDGTSEPTLGTITPSSTVKKMATAWGVSNTYGSVAGSATATGAFDGNFNVGTGITIGNDLTTGAGAMFGNIRNVRIWSRALSSSELQSVTA